MKRLISYLIVLLWLCACSKTIEIQRPEPLEQDPSVQVYFNQNQVKNADYSDPYRQIKRPGDNLEQILIDNVNRSFSSIDIAVQEFRLPKLAQALAQRHQQGVKIRVILENTYSRPLGDLTPQEVEKLSEREGDRYEDFFALADTNKDHKLSAEEINQSDGLIILKNAGIPIIDDTADGSKGSGLMHHKFIIIDGKNMMISSANFTLSDMHGDFLNPETRGNTNHLITINNPKIAQAFTEQFNLMWGDGVGGKPDSKFGSNKPGKKPQNFKLGHTYVTLKFSPDAMTQPWEMSTNGLIGKTLQGANSEVDLALFVFSEQKLANILEKRHQNGVKVRALIDPGFVFRSYSEGLDMLGVALSNKCRYEKDNHPWQSPITTVGIPSLPSGDKLHHKFGVIDQNTVITGSHNWSDGANYKNDETLIIIQSPLVAAHFKREFERLYSHATLGITSSLLTRIEKDKQKCPQILTPNSELANPKIVNLNTASQAELETLPGVGLSLAKRIIKARKEKPFTSLNDLERVSGMGKSKLKKLEGKVIW